MHSAVIYHCLHYTAYLHDKIDGRNCMFIDDTCCTPTNPGIMRLVREHSRVLIYSRDPVVDPIPTPKVAQARPKTSSAPDAVVNPIGIIPLPDAGPSIVPVPTMTMTAAFRDEVLRIKTIINTEGLRLSPTCSA